MGIRLCTIQKNGTFSTTTFRSNKFSHFHNSTLRCYNAILFIPPIEEEIFAQECLDSTSQVLNEIMEALTGFNIRRCKR